MGATSNLSRIAYILETVFGQTPGTGTPKMLRFTSESLAFNISTETSQEIRDDRMVADLVQTNAEANGGINYELSYASFDDFFEAAVGGTWTANTLKNGKIRRSFSVEVGFTDVMQFLNYRGMNVNTMSLEFVSGQITSGSFGFLGADRESGATSFLPGTPTPAPDTEVMDTVKGFADLIVDGEPIECGAGRITLNTDAGLRARSGLGKLGACEILLGTMSVTGEVDLYFEDGSIFEKQVQNEAFAISWNISDRAGNQYKFTLPRVKITNTTVNSGGLDTDVDLTLAYQAIRDPVTNALIIIERVPAPIPPDPDP